MCVRVCIAEYRRACSDTPHHRDRDRRRCIVAAGKWTRPHLAKVSLDHVRAELASRRSARHGLLGIRTTSIARARFGRRRMNPRSSRAMIKR